jgi:hypothetical protein
MELIPPPLAGGEITPATGKQGVWIYKAPKSIPNKNPVKIIAKSKADPTESAEAVVILLAEGG